MIYCNRHAIMGSGDFAMNKLINRLNRIKTYATSTEKRLIQYILENATEVVNMTLVQLSEQTNVSYATICRFCKKLSYHGYKELVADLSEYVEKEQMILDINKAKLDMSKSYSTDEIFTGICDISGSIIHDLQRMADIEAINNAISILLRAKSIYFIGLGTSAVSAHYAYTKLFRLGIPCSYDVDSTIFKMKASLMGRKDVLFAISSSGRTKSILESVQIARSNDTSIISLSDFAISPLTKMSTVNLYTTVRDTRKFMKDDFQLLVGQISIIDILHACCFTKMREIAQKQFVITQSSADSEKVDL
jgi:RpiR family carbohydrate utilization transcriptional regulator